MSRVIILTGTCGSGKSTVASLIAKLGWLRISEDDLWKERFGRNRGLFGSDEHRNKRQQVHQEVFGIITMGLSNQQSIVIDATVHESPPEAFHEYQSWFEAHGIAWCLRVLHPSLEVAITRDSKRSGWHAGPDRVSDLYAKFTGTVFGREAFIDTTLETPQETMIRVLAGSA
jgi:predicted kinase